MSMSQSKRDNVTFVHDMLVKLDGRLDDLTQVSARHDENLKEHMRRTEILEKELQPVKSFVDMAKGVGAFILIISLLATIAMVFK